MDEEQKKLMEELLFSGKKKQSFAKKLFFGQFDSQNLFPYPRVSDEERREVDLFVDKVEAFAKNNIDPDQIDRQAKIPDSVIKGLSELGVMGMTVPKEYGGLGFSQYAYVKVTETLARYCASTTLFVNVHQSIGLKVFLLFGTDEQKQKWLPKLARGELISAFSLTEPCAGSDAANVQTRAVFIPEKNCYRINGIKQWSTNASIAGVLTVMARTDDDKITAFLVTPDMKGFKVRDKALEKVGMRGTHTANLEFVDMDVPAENIIGAKGSGLKVALTLLDYGRTTFGAMCLGIGKFLLEKAVAHANTRIQFKETLASFGMIKKKIAYLAASLYAIDATVYMTAGLIDSHIEDIMLESTMLKVFSSERLWQMIYETMQIYGGRSFFTTEPLERIMRDARLNQIGEGANEVMKVFLAIVGLKEVGGELKGLVDQKKWMTLVRSLLYRFKTPHISLKRSELLKESKELAKAVRRFGIASVRVLGKFKEEIVKEQLVLERMAEALMALYTVSSVLSKADSETGDLSVPKLYCHEALSRLHAQLDALFCNNDQEIYAVSDKVAKRS